MSERDKFPHFRYRLRVNEKPVAGFMEFAPMSLDTLPLTEQDRDNYQGSGLTDRESISMKWGLIYDPEFEEWISSVGQTLLLPKDIQVEMLDEEGKKVGSFGLNGCRPTGLVAVPKAAPGVSMVAVETLVLGCEGWNPT